jgi:beta-1,4-mannosyltransferase
LESQSSKVHERRLRAGVVVVGDAGRSPRMARHAVALRQHQYDVELIALRGKDPSPDLAGVPVVLIDEPRAFRMIVIAVRLLQVLLSNRYDVLIVQNPPAFPTLPAAVLARCRFIVDWHNLTSSMLSLRTRNPFLLAVARRAEMLFARAARAHFAVTPQLAERLSISGIPDVTIVRDLPKSASSPSGARGALPTTLQWLNDHPREGVRLIAPTSWTADEDFDLLLASMRDATDVTLIVTGDGKLRDEYEPRLAGLPIAVATGWLDERAYEELLRSCDAGLSLHRSASGLDFPMKIVDFLGAGLPVIAFDFGEALRNPLRDTNSALFTNAAELATIVRERAFRPPPVPQRLWDEEWSTQAASVVLGVARG